MKNEIKVTLQQNLLNKVSQKFVDEIISNVFGVIIKYMKNFEQNINISTDSKNFNSRKSQLNKSFINEKR